MKETTDQVLGGDWLSAAAGGHDHLGQTLTHVLQAAGEGEHRHDFTGHRDVKLGLEDREEKCMSPYYQQQHDKHYFCFYRQFKLFNFAVNS